MASSQRPAPNASGTLAATPIGHALVYARNRKLTGRLELRARESDETNSADANDARIAEIHFWRGQIVQVSVTPSPCYLSAILYERGWLDTETLDASLLQVAKQKRLHGEILVERGTITRAQRDEALLEQMCRKVHHVFTFPPEGSFAFYEDASVDGAAKQKLDPLAPFWRGVCDSAPRKSVDDVLGRFAGAPLRLITDAPLVNVGLSKEERRIVEAIGELPMTIDEICSFGTVTPARAELLAYLLLAAKCIEPAQESQSKIPAATPSTPKVQAAKPPAPKAPAASPSQPRMPAASPSQSKMPATPLSQPRITAAAASGEMRRPSFSFRIPSSPTMKAARPASAAPRVATPDALGVDGIAERARTIDRESYFAVLGLQEGASAEAVRAAYFRLAKVWHPDKLDPLLAQAVADVDTIFGYMTRAHQTLTDATARKGYLSLRPSAVSKTDRADAVRAIEAALGRQDFATAETESRALAEGDTDDAEALALVAWAESWAGCAAEELLRASVATLDRAIAADRRCDRAHYYRGAIQAKLGNNDAAQRDYARCVSINPRHVEAQREVRLHEMRTRKRWI